MVSSLEDLIISIELEHMYIVIRVLTKDNDVVLSVHMCTYIKVFKVIRVLITGPVTLVPSQG